MLCSELIALINLEADELLDTDEDNIPYINQAMDFLSLMLAGIGDPEVIQTIDIIPTRENPSIAVPTDFMDFLPHNGYPVNILNGYFNVLTSSGECRKVKYTTYKPHVSNVTETIPFKDIYSGTLILIACYMIKKKTYIPPDYVQQDKAFVDEVLQAIRAAKGAGG